MAAAGIGRGEGSRAARRVLVPVQLKSSEGGPAAALTPLAPSPDSCVAGEGELTTVNVSHEARLERH